MKKISDRKTLLAEIGRLEQQQAVLEERIRQQWGGMKQSLKPSNAASTLVDTIFRKEPKTVKGTLLRSAMAFGVGLLVDRAGPAWIQMLRRRKQPA